MPQQTEASKDSPWGSHELTPGREHDVEVGPLTLSFRLDGDEIWISWQRSARDGHTGESASQDWQRWATAENSNAITIRPAFPDRPLVVSPEMPFYVATRATARIYVRIPLVAAIDLTDEDRTPLMEVPTIVLSKTWWGRVTDGELAYWLPTTARRLVEPQHFPPYLAVCPVIIQNRADEALEVEKVAIRAAHLSVFSTGIRLWGDETTVVYRADEDGSDVDVSGVAPREASGAVLMATAREPLTRGLRARTFARIKSLSGF